MQDHETLYKLRQEKQRIERQKSNLSVTNSYQLHGAPAAPPPPPSRPHARKSPLDMDRPVLYTKPIGEPCDVIVLAHWAMLRGKRSTNNH